MDQWNCGLDDTPIPSFKFPTGAGSKGRVLTPNVRPIKQFKVLLIAENPRDERRISELLPNVGLTSFDLEYTGQLSAGLKRLAEGGIQVVLLDLSLQGVGGIDGFLKVHAQAPDVPIIVLGDVDDEALALKVAQEGAQDFLVKRYLECNLLVRSIRFAIERARRRRAEKSMAEQQREMIRLEHLRALGQMASGIMHNFNNSLTPILSYAEILLLDSELPEKMRAPLDLILSSGHDAAAIVERLQEFYHPERSGDLVRRLNLGELLRQIPDLTRPKWWDEALRPAEAST